MHRDVFPGQLKFEVIGFNLHRAQLQIGGQAVDRDIDGGYEFRQFQASLQVARQFSLESSGFEYQGGG